MGNFREKQRMTRNKEKEILKEIADIISDLCPAFYGRWQDYGPPTGQFGCRIKQESDEYDQDYCNCVTGPCDNCPFGEWPQITELCKEANFFKDAYIRSRRNRRKELKTKKERRKREAINAVKEVQEQIHTET